MSPMIQCYTSIPKYGLIRDTRESIILANLGRRWPRGFDPNLLVGSFDLG